MSPELLVALKIIAMFVVMAVGYFSRRGGLLNATTTPVLSRFCTDVTLPALIFLQMVETVDLQSLKVGWTVPILATIGTCLGFMAGWSLWRAFASRTQAPVFIFASGISNWVYLPLPIVSAIYGSTGLQTLFLCNLGIQVLFWTLGVAILHGGRLDSAAVRHLATNPGLIATILGIVFAVLRGLTGDFGGVTAHQPVTSIVNISADSLRLLGQATIPVSLIVTGAQIAAAQLVQNRAGKAILGVVVTRLLIAPLLCIAMLWGFDSLFPVLTDAQLLVVAVILMMPVSVTSTVLTEKMNQDTAFAAQAVLYTTLASIGTVPLLYKLARMILTSEA